MKYQTIKMWKRYDPDARFGAGDFVNQIFLVDVEFSEEKFLELHPCNCNFPRDLNAHEFIKMPSGVFLKCKVQGTTEGIKPDILMGQSEPAGEWVKILKVKPLSSQEARQLFASKKFVASPDIIIHLLKGLA